jgi:hypothetical protein
MSIETILVNMEHYEHLFFEFGSKAIIVIVAIFSFPLFMKELPFSSSSSQQQQQQQQQVHSLFTFYHANDGEESSVVYIIVFLVVMYSILQS